MRTTGLILIAALLCGTRGLAQSADPQPTSTGTPAPGGPAPSTLPAPSATQPVQPAEDKRIFGVIPNNRTTEGSIPFQPITAKQKITIAFKDSFDWPVYPTAALFAVLYQLENQNPSFGQGMEGYAKRFATAYGDQMIGNMMTEGIVPAIFHQDPRYFRVGEGTKLHRARMALQQIVICKNDSGRKTFNYSEWGGNALATAISNAYYPDTRDVSDNVEKWLIAVATDSFSNILKEFWPDVKRKLHKHKDDDPLVSTSQPLTTTAH
jgi:hypothetical protein